MIAGEVTVSRVCRIIAAVAIVVTDGQPTGWEGGGGGGRQRAGRHRGAGEMHRYAVAAGTRKGGVTAPGDGPAVVRRSGRTNYGEHFRGSYRFRVIKPFI